MTKQRPVATTYGLAHPCSDDEPEQLYVFDDTDSDVRWELRRTTNEERPIRIEGWNGYAVPHRMHLTRGQARELAAALNQTLAEPDPPGTVTFTLPKPTMDDRCPLIPEGATDWEAEQIQRAWRNVFASARNAAATLVSACRRPSNQYPQTVASDGIMLAVSQAELASRLQGVKHRLALDTSDAEPAT